ncbi:MAG: adenylate/guanylate cyclase domain-containing protein, partial [Planctomycetota bacterium]
MVQPDGPERKLAAILSADVVGYSRLMADDEAATIRTVTAYREQIATLVREHRGRVVDSPGDNLLAEFPTALDAVKAAVEIQRVIGARNADLPQERRMEFRIGVHLGDITVERERVYGDGVNIAARLEGLAEAGGICISATVHEQVRSKLEVGFTDLGDHTVKNIPDRVHVYRVQPRSRPAESAPRAPGLEGRSRRWLPLAAGIALLTLVALAVWWRFSAAPPRAPLPTAIADPIRSIAVLPLDNLTGDPEQEYFVAGMHEALISSLARIGTGLRVISRTSAVQIGREGRTVPEIGAQLGVDGVIEGSAMREGDRVRVTVQLIDARSDHHLWARSYDREFSSALALTREISRSVAEQIRLVLSPERQRLLADSHSVDPQALDLYLSGIQHLNRLTLPDGRRAMELFKASIAADPEFAQAYEGLARAYSDLMIALWTTPPEEALPSMRDAASRAIELDGTLAQAHALLAQARWYMDFEWVETEASLSRALALEPMNVHVIRDFAWFLQWAGRFEEALALMRRAVAADPLNLVIRQAYGWTLYDARRFRLAIPEANRILERDPSFAEAHDLLGASHRELGDYEASYHAFRQMIDLAGRPPWFVDAWQRGYEQGGFK